MATKTGTSKANKIFGTTKADTLYGLGGADTLSGLAGIDRLYGGTSGDTLYGGTGNDWLNGGTGSDRLFGGTGNDTYVVSSIGDKISEKAKEGTDLVRAYVSWTLGANLENLTLLGKGKLNGTGNSLANVITGNSGDNVLKGGSGNDKLLGGSGKDTLNGGRGNDTMTGGAGDDDYFVNSTGDKVVETAKGGVDLVNSSVSWTLGAYVEVLYLTGAADVNGTGNDFTNFIKGNSGDNLLDGRGGDDKLYYSGGNDTFLGGDGDDTVDFSDVAGTHTTPIGQVGVSVNLGSVTIGDLAPGRSYSGALKETIVLSSIENIVGTKFGDFIIGNDENNQIEGLAGIDLIDGGRGFDFIDGGDGADVIRGGKGGDNLIGGAGEDIFIFGNYATDSGTDSTSVFDGTDVSPLADVIYGFERGVDKIALNEIDAVTGGADSAFAADVSYRAYTTFFTDDSVGNIGATVVGDTTIVFFDRGGDGNGAPDFYVALNAAFTNLTAADFIL
jgi:Ca2+-binding RTX toxin-like protein